MAESCIKVLDLAMVASAAGCKWGLTWSVARPVQRGKILSFNAIVAD